MTELPPEPDPVFDPAVLRSSGLRPGDPPPEVGAVTAGTDHQQGSNAGTRWVIILVVVGAVMVGGMMVAIGVGVFR